MLLLIYARMRVFSIFIFTAASATRRPPDMFCARAARLCACVVSRRRRRRSGGGHDDPRGRHVRSGGYRQSSSTPGTMFLSIIVTNPLSKTRRP